jgi:sporulation protein YlmC with PRC-barrel domain
MIGRVSAATLLAFAISVATADAQTQTAPAANTQAPAAKVMTAVPAESSTVTHWYKQNVYDPADNKIGEVMDVLVNRDGKIEAFIVGVGGFLGAGEKDVAVPFNDIRFTTKNNNKWYMVMNTTKDAMKAAPGFKDDRNSMAWIPENAPATTGSSTVPPPR